MEEQLTIRVVSSLRAVDYYIGDVAIFSFEVQERHDLKGRKRSEDHALAIKCYLYERNDIFTSRTMSFQEASDLLSKLNLAIEPVDRILRMFWKKEEQNDDDSDFQGLDLRLHR